MGGERRVGEDQKKEVSTSELGRPRGELGKARQDYLEQVKKTLKELFGTEKMLPEFVQEMLRIRKTISDKVRADEFVDSIEYCESDIQSLADAILFRIQDQGGGGSPIEAEQALRTSLHDYFDTFRLSHNAARFRQNVEDTEQVIVAEHQLRKSRFYSEGEKREALLERLQEKYHTAGFSEEEFKALIDICHAPALDTLEIHQIRVLAQIQDIFSRFMSGDTTRYVALSAALLVPAFLEGYAPMFLANAFKGNKIDMTQIGLYALVSSVAAGLSVLLQKQFKDFLDNNFQKEGGVAEHIAQNVAELPAQEMSAFGTEAIKQRIANGKESYEGVLRTISFDVLPTVVTLVTSAAMLYQKNALLAFGTAAGSGIMIALDSYLGKRGRFWEKERKAERQREDTMQHMDEQLSAHMEIILSGQKGDFTQRMEALLSQERVASSDRKFLGILEGKLHEFFGVLNMIIAGITTYIAGGSPDKFVAALVYSGNFKQGISNLLHVKRRLLSSFRDILQMELMFNGYAKEEQEKETQRIGVDEVQNSALDCRDVGVAVGGKMVLDGVNLSIPAGSMVSLQGASGAGKTTLMKVLAGYYRPTSGEVQFGGVDMERIKKSGEKSVYSRISYLSQFPFILQDSVRNNLLFGVKQSVPDERIAAILDEVGLAGRFRNLDERLVGGRGDSGTTSGGETSRIGLARVLLKIRNSDSRIVFLDEPTASVDEKTRDDIAKIVNKEKEARPDVTFIVISHDTEFLAKLHCTSEIKMKEGRVEVS